MTPKRNKKRSSEHVDACLNQNLIEERPVVDIDSCSTENQKRGKAGADNGAKKSKKKGRVGASSFILNLFRMVNNREHEQFIGWTWPGTSFIVRRAMEFSQDILPRYYKHRNFSSFIRQLNMYGFQKVNRPSRGYRPDSITEVYEFSHPEFTRDGECLLEKIKRHSAGSTQSYYNITYNEANYNMINITPSQVEKIQEKMNDAICAISKKCSELEQKIAEQQKAIELLQMRSNTSKNGFNDLESQKFLEKILNPVTINNNTYENAYPPDILSGTDHHNEYVMDNGFVGQAMCSSFFGANEYSQGLTESGLTDISSGHAVCVDRVHAAKPAEESKLQPIQFNQYIDTSITAWPVNNYENTFISVYSNPTHTSSIILPSSGESADFLTGIYNNGNL
ncbi:Heat shock factor protein 1 [Zancudomyces culisetae]|uniref:Heat shock factor protein 1 n=1 Tax=Zancudomyces culisetae TaxID=1213189 RepID=A0A1R1PWF9_ZANCU|nr:Heat shock factor protein 1 [Zancudomyces culisetae]|eukprot:OMH85264.1 Heat shock factor protein 1 [Zancudomyces culisetae]